MKSLLILLAATSFAAQAETFVARQGDDSVRLTDQPCTDERVLNQPGMRPLADEFRAAVARFQGQTYNACWRKTGNVFYLVYEDGDQGIIPAHELKPELDV
jgi:hypothetical protein